MNDDLRPDPDSLLEAIQRQDDTSKRGQLKIFLGMAAGVGKTYAMLEAARKQLSQGVDVVVGYVETHGRKDTDALNQGLPAIPRKTSEHRGIKLSEMDVDALLERRPKLALVDELAHTNAPGSRHPKRYQDILELLDAGIDVYTTLNVQHVESRAQTVEQITGSTIHETVPDRVLDLAEIELIDISPDDLMRRLDEGKVYMPDRAAVAMVNFFREGNLTALREMALRLAAERVGQDVRDYHQVMQIQQPWKTGHRLLVAVSASPLSAQLVRWTRRLADSLDGQWLALHVETSRPIGEAEQAQLTRNLALARELGAEVVTSVDEDVIRGVLRVARQHNVTQIVVGKPAPGGWRQYFGGGPLPRRLVEESGDIDIHVVRAGNADGAQPPRETRPRNPQAWNQYALGLAVVGGVTLFGHLLNPLVVNYRAVALLYLLAVVVLALFVGRGPVLVAATVSALLWNFFFLPPVYTFWITTFEDGLMFGMYFVVAVVMGQLVSRFRAQERAERRREERTAALYLLTRELVEAVTVDAIVKVIVNHIGTLFRAEAAVLLANGNGRLATAPRPGGTLTLSDKEFTVAAWVFQHNQKAGQFTDNLPSSEAIHIPLATAGNPVGVLAVRWPGRVSPTFEQTALLDSIARQAALVLDRQRLHEVAQQSQLAAESERLSRTLLDSISHELRTPIAAIASAAGVLGETSGAMPPGFENVLGEIREAVDRLNRLVGNLLDIARVESGQVKPKLDWCDVGDLIHVTVKHLERELGGRPVEITIEPALPLVWLDFVLMEQALTNLLLNAANHTPAGRAVRLTAARVGRQLVLTVTDEGPGIPEASLPRLFDKFYRVPGTATGGTGLGLSIVKGFVEAQNGRVQVENQSSGGARFTISLPLGDAPAVLAEPA